MLFSADTYSVLVVSGQQKLNEALRPMLPSSEFYPVSFCTNAADVFCIVKDTETSRVFEHVHQFNELHAETHVGLVGTETTHGFAPRQA